jgi:hypothetical protein
MEVKNFVEKLREMLNNPNAIDEHDHRGTHFYC